MIFKKNVLNIVLIYFLSTLFSSIVIGQITIIDDPLQGSTLGTKVGGTIDSEGYKPRIGKYFKSGVSEDHILYNIGRVIEDGYVQFQVKGFNMSDFEPTSQSLPSRESGFITLYDGRGISEPLSYDPDAKHNYFYWVIHYRSEKYQANVGNKWKTIINCAEPIPTRINSTKAVFTDATGDNGLVEAQDGVLNILDRDWTVEPNGLRTNWDSEKWYTVKIEWNNDQFKVYLDGDVVWFNELEEGQPWTAYDNSTPQAAYPWKPLDLKIWLGSGPGRYDNDMPNITYRNFKVVDYDDSIPPTPTLNVTSPNGGEILSSGETYQIKWNSSLVSNVKIDFSPNNGVSWNTISSSTSSDGFFSWIVPNSISTECLIRIEDITDPEIFDLSNSNFSIKEQSQDTSLKILFPNGGEELLIGESENIIWNAPLGTNNVTLFFSSNYDVNNPTQAIWSTIGSSGNSGNYSWVVPDVVSSQCAIRIKDSDDFTDVDISDSSFTIRNYSPILTILSPNGGGNYLYNDSLKITWFSQDIDVVNLDYSTNYGTSWINIADSLINVNEYNWQIPKLSSDSCLLRITDYSNNLNVDISDSIFSMIEPFLTLTSPNGGEQLLPSENYLITWTSQNVNWIRLEYSTNNGSSWLTIADSIINENEYSWLIPNEESDSCIIRVTNLENNMFSDVSDTTFSIIIPSISISSPNGGEEWTVNSLEEILWNSKHITSVGIYYSINEGINWISISDSTISDGNYSWTIPNNISENCRIKIVALSDTSLFSESENNFVIKQITHIDIENNNLPDNFELKQNFPNPFNPSTEINYALPKETNVKINVFNILGKQVKTLVNKFHSPGYYRVNFNGENLPSGIYFYKIQTDGFNKTKTMLMIK